MPYVNVEIDLDEIDTNELVEECCRRLKKEGSRKSLTDKQKKELKESYYELAEVLSMTPSKGIDIKTLSDKIKYEHLSNVFEKYSLTQIQSKLPE